MGMNQNLSTRLREKANKIQESVQDEELPQGPPIMVRSLGKRWLVAVLGGVACGAIFYFLTLKGRDAAATQKTILAGLLLGILPFVSMITTRWYAVRFELRKIARNLLKGRTQGVVVEERREVDGAVRDARGFTYCQTFVVEYEVAGENYKTGWKMDFATNIEKLLHKTSQKYMGAIVPVSYDLDDPTEAIAGTVKKFSRSQFFFLLGSFFLAVCLVSSAVAAIELALTSVN